MPNRGVDLLVLGSTNVDHVVVAEAFPAPGETVRGTGTHSETGGKGTNQAVAAAPDGARIRMAARIGPDAEGEQAQSNLIAHGVNVRSVDTVAAEPTGTGWITVAQQDNTIVIIRGPSGAVVTDGFGSTRLSAVPAPVVVDTAGAGDAFTCVLAARLAIGDGLAGAAQWASTGSHAVRATGAQPSYSPFAALKHEVAALHLETT